MAELRHKYNKQLEELQEALEQQKKQRMQTDKGKGQIEAELAEVIQLR